MHGQAPGTTPPSDVASSGFVEAMQHLGWIDITALSVLLVFFVLGLFKGIVWQASRVLILGAAYALAAQFGHGLGNALLNWTHSGPQSPTEDQQLTAFYIGCVLIFIGVLVVLSLLALVVQSLVQRAGLGFYDRLFGGLAGVGSGAIVVLFLLTVVFMFFPQSKVAEAATSSHSLRFSQRAVDMLGNAVPPDLRAVFPQSRSGSPDGAPQPADASGQKGAAARDATQPQPSGHR